MALQFVLGPAGSGKTKYLYDYVLSEAKKNPTVTYYYIVPEQFSLITQWDFLSRPDCKGILNIDVTSLKRLSDKAFGILSGLAPEFLPEIAKSMIIKKVLLDRKDELKLYRRNAAYPGFVAEAKALLSELMQYSVSEEVLKSAIDEGAGAGRLQHKLQDALTLLAGLNEYLGEKKVTQEGRYDRFAELAEKSGVLKDAVVVLDGFTGFTPSQREILKKILMLTQDVKCAITIDEWAYNHKIGPYHMFNMSKEAIGQLTELALEVKVDVEEPVFTTFDKYNGKGLSTLLKNIYSLKKETGDTDAVTLFAAGDIAEEAQAAAIRIEKLLREEGYKLNDIAVLVSDLEAYGERVYEELSRISGNVFLDRKKSLYENEGAGFVTLLLRLMEKGPDADLLISVAKNNLSGISHEDACLMETYCKALGVRGSAFSKPFTKQYYGKLYIDTDRVNSARELLYNKLKPIFKVKARSAAAFAALLTETLEAFGVEDRLYEKADILREQGDMLAAQVYDGTYGAVTEILSQMVSFLGDDVITPQEFRGICEAGLTEAKVGLVPKGAEQIIIGDLERTRLKNIKALFLLGANEGMLPKPAAGRPILTDKDKKTLEAMGITLSPDAMKKIGNDRFYTYLALTKPTDKLYLSWAGRDKENKLLKPSSVVRELQAVFPALKVTTWESLPVDEQTLKNDLGKSYELMVKRNRMAAAIAAGTGETERISEEAAEGLYGKKLRGSVSRLETFAGCPFKHFANYGLRLTTTEEYELSALDFGDVAHEALEHYGKSVKEEGLKWAEVTPEHRDELILRCAEEATGEYKEGIFKDTEKNTYVKERVAEALKVTVEMLTKQLEGTLFEPEAFEKRFVTESDDFAFTGKIDRIDSCEVDGKKAVKIIDYKSSEKEVHLDKLYYGQSLQLPLYMEMELKEAEGTIPAAMLYNVIDDPIMDLSDKAGAEDVTAALKKMREDEFRPKGLINTRADVLMALDTEFDNGNGQLKQSYSSGKLEAATNKDGDVKLTKHMVSEEELRMICDFADKKVKKQTAEIKSGIVGAEPAYQNKMLACAYCKFHSVCGFDTSCGSRYRAFKALSKDDALIRIRKEEQDG